MKLTIDRADLAAAIDAAAGVVESRTTIPSLAMVRLAARAEGGAGMLTAWGTNLNQWVEAARPANVERAGGLCVDAKRLAGLAASLPDGAVALEGAGARLVVRAGGVVARLPALDQAEFPPPPDTAGAGVAVRGAHLLAAIDGTRHAQSTEEARYYLCGLHIHAQGDGCRIVATDGYRMAYVDVAAPLVNAPGGVIVPRRAVETLARWLAAATRAKDGGADIRVAVDEKTARFDFGAHALTTKLIDAEYPDYARVTPAPTAAHLVVDGAALLVAVRQAMLAAASFKEGRVVRLDWSDGALVVTGAGEGEIAARVAAEAASDGAFAGSGLNGAYLAHAVEALGAGPILIDHAEAGVPYLLRGAGDEAQRHIQIIMPLRD